MRQPRSQSRWLRRRRASSPGPTSALRCSLPVPHREAEWEGELAYRVFSGQGAFDVEEIDLEAEPQPTTTADPPRELVRVEAVRSEEEAVVETQEMEMVAEPSAVEVSEPDTVDAPASEDHDPLADLPRQALFDMAKELGVPMKDLIVMDREELIEAIHRAEPAHSS